MCLHAHTSAHTHFSMNSLCTTVTALTCPYLNTVMELRKHVVSLAEYHVSVHLKIPDTFQKLIMSVVCK